ncbi:MAG TPA: M20 family metallopeptidase [Vicinamibacterales bacterium]|jgi:glutamate carboxypeptidase|nr:M20 family metallopeptidase [Vicinamibacterales bacterium]
MPRLYDLQKFCRSESDWLIQTVEALVRLESPTTDKAAVDRCGRELASRMEAAGGRVTRLSRSDRGDHLRGEFPAASPHPRDATPQVLLLGHFDTVWPIGQLAQMPLERRGGRLHGPGTFDMKAGIAIGLLATRALSEAGGLSSHRIVMLWTTDEEFGSGTSRAAIEDEARRSDAVLVLEPSLPGGALKTSRKGCGGYEIVVRGVSAHAGIEPQKGASAVQELAQQILHVNALQDLDRGILVNVVQVSGGRRSNVIPDEARATVDVRVPTAADASCLDAALRSLRVVDPRTSLSLTGGVDRPPLERSEHVERLYNQAHEVARQLGQTLGEGSTGGGSDGNFTAALGVPTLDGLGAIGDGAHALHEHVEIEPLVDRAALVAGLVATLSHGLRAT